MSELNWKKLRVDMLSNGIAPKYVRRTILELTTHYAELKSQAQSEGLNEPEADARASREIGDEATILAEALSKPELRSLQSKYPRLFFLAVPTLTLIACIALVVASLLYFASSPSWLGGLEPGTELAPWRKGVIDYWLMANSYLVTPLLALATVAIARQRLIKPQWPALGIVLLAITGSGWAYGITWPTPDSLGSLQLKWGYSLLPQGMPDGQGVQNYVKILVTVTSAAVFWWLYDPVGVEPAASH